RLKSGAHYIERHGLGSQHEQAVLRRVLLNGRVRFRHKADVGADPEGCPLLGVKRTSLIHSLMSANDPKRTFGRVVRPDTGDGRASSKTADAKVSWNCSKPPRMAGRAALVVV